MLSAYLLLVALDTFTEVNTRKYPILAYTYSQAIDKTNVELSDFSIVYSDSVFEVMEASSVRVKVPARRAPVLSTK